MVEKFNSLALGYTGAIISAVAMLFLGILGNLGIYSGAVTMMQQAHSFFSLSVFGIAAGMVEAAIMGFVFLYLLGWIYNKLA